jgi:peptide/nickel transport system substrate-binding protein
MDEMLQRDVDVIRFHRSELENHLIDQYAGGKISRREFVRRGTVIGLSLPLLSFIAAACGGDEGGEEEQPSPQVTGTPQPGGTIRTGIIAPAGALDPLTVADEGGLAVLGQSGEYLAWSDENLQLQPRIAESWTPNEDGSVWTFTIRQGVAFHDGAPLTANDVAATMNLLSDPKSKSNALSAFGGVLSPGGAKALDDATVEFSLDAPNGSFPYLLSSDNYNAIVLPANFSGDWEETFIGTGPWVLDTYTPEVGVSYTKNPDYWDTSRSPIADRSELTFYNEDQARVLGLQGDEVDVVSQFPAVGGQALLNDPNIAVIEVRATQHRQVHMRTDQAPFQDKRTRQAMALLLDRPAIIQGLLDGKSDIGNDSPFAPVYPFTDTSVPQRAADVEQARQLLSDAGQAEGFDVTLYTWDQYEIPQLAQVIQQAAKEVGITVKLSVTDAGTYYSKHWLDSSLGITDYGHRGVPNVFLTAPLASDGVWNSAHFANPTYDSLVKDYIAALDLDSQRAMAKQIQELLLDETPIIFPYFYFHLTAATTQVVGVETTGMGHIDLTRAGFTA